MIKVIESNRNEDSENRDLLDIGKLSFEEIYDIYVKSGNYSGMSYAVTWGFTDDDLRFLASKFKTGNNADRKFIIDLLEDCNFHSEWRIRYSLNDYEHISIRYRW